MNGVVSLERRHDFCGRGWTHMYAAEHKPPYAPASPQRKAEAPEIAQCQGRRQSDRFVSIALQCQYRLLHGVVQRPLGLQTLPTPSPSYLPV